MRRDIIFVILLLIVTITFGQTTTRKGHYNAHRGDSIGVNRTTKDKAIMDCFGLSLTNYDNEDIYFTYPERSVVSYPKIDTAFKILAIWEKNVTETSIVIDVQFNQDNLGEVYVRFRREGGIWQRTNSDPTNVYWIGLLQPQSTYEYMVYAKDTKGNMVNSDLLTFETK